MKLLFDFFPIVLFFIGYKFFGIYVATVVAMVVSFFQVGYFWFKNRRFEITHIITLFSILLLGSATLLLRNVLFIKWKPTVIYWILAIIFLGSQIFCKKMFIQHLVGEKITLQPKVWKKLNFSWAIFFSLMGALNLYVAYFFNTDTWVNFKLFGTLIGTLVFAILQSLYISKHIKYEQKDVLPSIK
jgi:intracellular septation protein